MMVVVNGSPLELEHGAPVAEAIAVVRSDPAAKGIAVAVNGTVVPRSAWSETRLSEDDKVEVLTAVAGG